MADVVHTSRLRLERIAGPLRHAYLDGFDEPIRFGVHGGIKEFYGVEPDEDVPATLDHIRQISEAGERMPAKSTYFYPKLLSGLVIHSLQ